MNHIDLKCPICGRDGFIEIAQRDRYGFKVSSLLCFGCGTITLNPRLSLDEYGDFYTNEYRSLVSRYWNKTIVADMDTEEYGESLAQFFELKPGRFAGMRVLDIGGSSGGVAAVLKNRCNMDITVCDPNRAELEEAKKRGLETVEGTIENSDIGGSWDMILMCRTVDHLFDPIGSLRAAHDLLSPHGWMFIDIVDWLCVARSEGVVNSFHTDHPFNFTPDQFRFILDELGFSIISERISPEELGVNSGRIEHGFLCKKTPPPCSGMFRYSGASKLLDEIRRIQAEERARIVPATIKK